MGRANRVLARIATKVASSFPKLMGLPESAKSKLVVTGNPVRDIALKERAAPYPSLLQHLILLVFGGSQGAQFFGDFMPKVFAEMPREARATIRLTQQVRAQQLNQVKALYDELGVACELRPFFIDMPRIIAGSHLVVCRSGASTIAELGVIGRPAIMVPLPHALDNDQLRNAESFAAAGAGWIHPQASLEPKAFAAFLTSLRSHEGELRRAAEAALGHGKPDAAKRLASLTEQLAGIPET
jgi:UDP-N-acetylglucosamine--N-acetylmuramyl-(pentapeptide) pyrophosphoryl-undecaprenol N-acetylglucosamine transferase